MPKPPAPAPVDAVRDRLATLYRTAQIFNSTLDLDQVLNLVMDQVIEVIGAERGFLILRESDGRLTFHAARGMQQTVIDQPEFQVSRSIIERVATEGTPLLTSDAQSDDRFAAQKSVMFLSLRSILCVPLQTREKNIGVIYVDNRLRAGIFGENALELLVALANQAAVAIENARLFSDVRQKAERLALLNAIGADLTSTLDLHHVLESIIERLRGLIQVEAGSLQTLEGDELVFQIALGEKSDRVRAFRFPADRGCAGWSVQNRESVLVNDVTQDPRFFDKLDATSGLQTRAVLCAPMLVQDKVTGVIELVNKIGGPFTADDRDLLTTIAASAAIAIENARLYELAVDRGRLEREIQVAAEVQASLIPAAPPHIPGFEIGTLWQPARQAAGDFYDFVALDDDRQAFIVADVSDKGLAAAFFMALCRSILRSSIVSTRPHADRIKKANQLICADAAANGMFVTAFFAVLDPRSRELFYVNAGHNPPMLYRAATGAMDVLPRTGIALGVLEESDYREGRVQLNPGDVLVMYTDGVTEAMNEREEPFEEPRLVQVIRDKCVSAAEVACGLDAALKEFVGTHAPHDDITVVVIKCAA